MAICPFITSFLSHGSTRRPFPPGAPFGIVLHRTLTNWDVAGKFAWVERYPHFFVGKTGPISGSYTAPVDMRGGLIQYQDTAYQTAHMKGENQKYIGIEFEVEDVPTYNNVAMTSYQITMGRILIDWLCKEHRINKYGPPPRQVVNILNRNFHGVLSHADIQKGINPGAITNHGDAFSKADFAAFGIQPYPLMTY
jgi:hypothetical protein